MREHVQRTLYSGLASVVGLILIAVCGAAGVEAQILINEVMPDTAAPNDASEWLELFNYTAQSVDLRGWKIDGQMVIGADPVLIPAFGFKIITKDLAAFGAEFGVELPALQLPISLRNSSDEILLENTNNAQGVVDRLTYASVPAAESWERKGPGCTDLVAAAPSAAARNSAVDSACYPPGTSFPDIQLSLDGQSWMASVLTLSPATVQFRLQGVDLAVVSDLTWSDSMGNPVTNPIRLGGSYNSTMVADFKLAGQPMRLVSRPIQIVPQLSISEFMPDPDGADSGAEWVEIYNPNSYSVELAGMEIYANAESVFTISQQQLGPNAYKQIGLTGSQLRNCSSSCDYQVALKYQELELDKVAYSSTEPGHSWSLDGQIWHLNYPTSPGSQNLPPVVVVSTAAASTSIQSASTATMISSSAPATSKYAYAIPQIYYVREESVGPLVWRVSEDLWLLGAGICCISSGLALWYWSRLRLDSTSLNHPVQVPILGS